MELIRKVRKTGFTIAPEAGSPRLREVINKNIAEAEIFNTVRDAFQLGWNLIKLYFMIGLPTETPEDLQALVELVMRLRRIRVPGRGRGQLNVSLATFIPKPHTPFQWARQISLEESREKLRWVEERLSVSGVQFKWQNPRMSLLEGVFARGDRRLGAALAAAHRRGCRFDGWSDRFDHKSWEEAFAETGIDPGFFTGRERDPAEPLPWDHIDSRVDRKFLKSEWERALRQSPTPDCRRGDCQTCGVCDFKDIRPRVYETLAADAGTARREAQNPARPAKPRPVELCFEKLGPARFFGHLELVKIFLRAMRRAKLPVTYSEGFHPKPKVSFENPLPTGMESEEERMVLTLSEDIPADALADRLNAQLPEGLRALACARRKAGDPAADRCVYRVIFPGPVPEALDPDRGVRPDLEQTLNVVSVKGKLKKFVLRDILFGVERIDSATLALCMACSPGSAVRPSEILKQVFRVPEERLGAVRIRKLRTP
jgi:radical SAM-linked protein